MTVRLLSKMGRITQPGHIVGIVRNAVSLDAAGMVGRILMLSEDGAEGAPDSEYCSLHVFGLTFGLTGPSTGPEGFPLQPSSEGVYGPHVHGHADYGPLLPVSLCLIHVKAAYPGVNYVDPTVMLSEMPPYWPQAARSICRRKRRWSC